MGAATALMIVFLAVTSPPVAGAQDPPQNQPPGRQGRGGGQMPAGERPQAGGPVSPMQMQEIQQMFDAVELLEAERFLQLTEQQYPTFLQKLRALQQTRRRHQQQRMRWNNQMRQLVMPPGPNRPQKGPVPPPVDDATLEARLKEYADLETTFRQEIQAAQQAIDDGLNVRQRIWFRLFGEHMERRRLDFVAKARIGR